MKKALALFLFITNCLLATPTGLFWSPCQTDVLDPGKGHIDFNNYFTVFNSQGHGQTLPPDVGFEAGLFEWNGLKMEAGVDYLGGTDFPLFFNGKVGMNENALFKQAPSWSVGVFNWGTRTHSQKRTNQNVFNINLGKDLPEFIGGTLYLGAYSGSKALGGTRQGLMFGISRSFYRVQDAKGVAYDRWTFVADYVTGNNAIGGGGFGMIYNFTPDISLEMGPTWFNSRKINGRWKWAVQLDIGFEMW